MRTRGKQGQDDRTVEGGDVDARPTFSRVVQEDYGVEGCQTFIGEESWILGEREVNVVGLSLSFEGGDGGGDGVVTEVWPRRTKTESGEHFLTGHQTIRGLPSVRV